MALKTFCLARLLNANNWGKYTSQKLLIGCVPLPLCGQGVVQLEVQIGDRGLVYMWTVLLLYTLHDGIGRRDPTTLSLLTFHYVTSACPSTTVCLYSNV